MCVRTYVYTCVCMYVCMCVRTCTRVYVCMYVRTYVRVHVCMYVCVCMYASMLYVKRAYTHHCNVQKN
jgi:hypothetical protein